MRNELSYHRYLSSVYGFKSESEPGILIDLDCYNINDYDNFISLGQYNYKYDSDFYNLKHLGKKVKGKEKSEPSI